MDRLEEKTQVILTGTFGDGSIKFVSSKTASYSSNCKHKEYLEYKATLLGEELFNRITKIEKNGYSQTPIYQLYGRSNSLVFDIHTKSLEEKLEMLTELGIALWFYDDGSLHKKNMFYNLNTHAFNKEENEIISKFLNSKLKISSRVISETKKDGRKFWYIYVPRTLGADVINDILNKYPIECYSYKRWSKEETEDFKSLQSQAILEGCSTLQEIRDKIFKLKRKRAAKTNNSK